MPCLRLLDCQGVPGSSRNVTATAPSALCCGDGAFPGKNTKDELFDPDLMDAPSSPPPQPHTKLEADPCNTVVFLTSGPAPSALMSRAPASHCDFCLSPPPAFILAVTAAMSRNGRVSGDVMGGGALYARCVRGNRTTR